MAMEAMKSAAEHSADAMQNLSHIYFFLDQFADIAPSHTLDGSRYVTPTKTATHHPKSRDSSPASTSTGSSTSVTGSASTTSSNLNPKAMTFSPGGYSAQDARSSPPRAEGQMFEMRQIEGKGLGLVATAMIPRGTRIISEKPLLSIPDNMMYLAWGSYCRLSNTQKKAYDKLHVYAPNGMNLENISRMFLIDQHDSTMDAEDVDELVAEQVRVMSIFAVNNFNVTPKGLAVYTTTSRLNHSCAPNAFHGFNPNMHRFTVYAIRDIASGEEITINYSGGHSDYMLRSQRVEHLRTNYGFTCDCSSCSDKTPDSDGRRELVNNICWGLNEYEMGASPAYPFIADSVVQAFQLAVNAVNFLNAEGLQSIEFMKALRAASKYALDLQDWHTAYEYALREQEIQLNIMGPEVQDLVQSGAAASCWVKRVKNVIIAALCGKQANKVFQKHQGESVKPKVRHPDGDERVGESKRAKKAKKGQAKKAMARKHEDEKLGKAMETLSTDAQKDGGTKAQGRAGKEAKASTWAKVAAGGGEKGTREGSGEGWRALEKEKVSGE